MENRRKIAARAAQWGEAAPMRYRGGAEMGSMRLMGLMGGETGEVAMREQRRGGEAVLFPGVL